MLIPVLQQILERDLNALISEVRLYQREENLWIVDKQISNSGGNLCLHLVGNLKTFIGKQIGGFEYQRDRPREFSEKNIPRPELLSRLEETRLQVVQSLEKLGPGDLEKEYPLLVLEKKTSVEYFLVHLTSHLSYHLGQVNYHRRLLDQPAKSISL